MRGSRSGEDCRAFDEAASKAESDSTSRAHLGITDKDFVRRRIDVTEIFSVLRFGIAGGESLRRKWGFVNRAEIRRGDTRSER